jgi:hypothetical protein
MIHRLRVSVGVYVTRPFNNDETIGRAFVGSSARMRRQSPATVDELDKPIYETDDLEEAKFVAQAFRASVCDEVEYYYAIKKTD